MRCNLCNTIECSIFDWNIIRNFCFSVPKMTQLSTNKPNLNIGVVGMWYSWKSCSFASIWSPKKIIQCCITLPINLTWFRNLSYNSKIYYFTFRTENKIEKSYIILESFWKFFKLIYLNHCCTILRELFSSKVWLFLKQLSPRCTPTKLSLAKYKYQFPKN